MFLHVSVILFRGRMVSQHALQVSRGVVSQRALQVVSQHALQVSRGVSGPTPRGEVEGSGQGGSPGPHLGGSLGPHLRGSPGPHPGGLQAHTRGVSRPTSGGGLQAHTRGGSLSQHALRQIPPKQSMLGDTANKREIRPTSGRYASYWNAFLLLNHFNVDPVLRM